MTGQCREESGRKSCRQQLRLIHLEGEVVVVVVVNARVCDRVVCDGDLV